MPEQEDGGIGKVVDMKEVAARHPGAQIRTPSAPSARARSIRAIRPGTTWLFTGSKLSPGP